MPLTATFYGGPLDGATTVTRRALYLDDNGVPVAASRGDRAWCGAAVSPRRFYARRTTGHTRTYVHWTAWHGWVSMGKS